MKSCQTESLNRLGRPRICYSTPEDGFTPFSEAKGPEQVHKMLVTYFGELAPMIDKEFHGEVQDFVGDQIFGMFYSNR